MKSKVNFTKAALSNLKSASTPYEIRDSQERGLICGISPSGRKTLMFLKKVRGKNKRIKIGTFPDISVEQARNITADMRRKFALLEHQPESVGNNNILFRVLFDRYYQEHAIPHTKRPQDTLQLMNLHVFKRVGSSRVRDIPKSQMREIHRTLGAEIGEQQSNRILDMVSAVFNYGIREEIISIPNPCTGIRRFKRISRDRFLTSDELPRFFEALHNEEQIYQDFFMLSLFVGARKTTMLSMRFDEIEFQLKTWRLGHEKTKNGDVNVHPLSDAAIEILQRRKKENERLDAPSLFVFPGAGKTGHLKDPKKSFARIKTTAGISDLRIHDLRRTLGSYMAINKASLPIIAKALNHKSTVSTEIYARLAIDPVREAVNEANKTILVAQKTKAKFGYGFKVAYQIPTKGETSTLIAHNHVNF